MWDGDSPALMSPERAANATVNIFTVMQPTFSRKVFIESMRGMGFVDEWDLSLLEAKYYYGMSAKRIADEQHYVSRRTVSRRLEQLRALLRERGYKRSKK
jgi:hypothetical protein